MNYLKINQVLDYCMQLARTLIIANNSDKLSYHSKILFFERLLKAISRIYTNYICTIYSTQILMDTFNSTQKIAMFGAGTIGKRYRKTIFSSIKNKCLIFIDNDLMKHGLFVDGIKVISIDEYKTLYPEHKILISMHCVLSCISQLLRLNIINDISELLPFNGNTQFEKNLLDGIEIIFRTLDEIGVNIEECNV